jgi:D-arginine dehydrogenase
MDFDIVIIGAGIAGATAAAHLSPQRRVALVEAEESAGYHTTGRSAALWLQNYGPHDVRELSRLSRGFFENPPRGFAADPLMRRRAVLLVASAAQLPHLEETIRDGIGLRRVDAREAARMLPAIRPGAVAAAAVEDDAFDMDVAAIHQGFLRQLRENGGTLALRHRAGAIERAGGVWTVRTTTQGVFRAPVVVNAAGAWGDVVAGLAGVTALGLVPKRRTAALIEPLPHHPEHWPMICDVQEQWYARPEARTRLMVSPADETPDVPHDVQPEEIDVALGIDRMQQVLDIDVRRIEHKWAGLRTFTPDGSLAFGWDAQAEGFFWSVGQGGYGIQTSPAAGKLVADLVLGRDPGEAGGITGVVDPRRFSPLRP